MATQGQYLVNGTVNDCNALLVQLQAARTTITRIIERMEALGVSALAGHAWPEGYTQADFVALYQALNALPGCVVPSISRGCAIGGNASWGAMRGRPFPGMSKPIVPPSFALAVWIAARSVLCGAKQPP